jgi:formylglycine-generating enzyme required for sulfatase activity
MFDNGAVLEIKPQTEFLIEKFEREPFDPSGVDYKTIPEEPTSSKTKLKVDTGVILMGVKKLKPSSEFQIETPVGMTGIRGTSLFVKYDKAKPEEGTIVGVTEGKVEFLTPTGTNQPINAGESFGITDSPTGATIKPNPPGASVLMAETRGVDRAIRQTAPAKSFESAPVTTGGDASLDVAPIKPEMIKVEGGSLPKDSQVPNKTVKAFEIGKYEVTWGEWQKVRDWAVANGYDLKDVGQGLRENHPVTGVNLQDVVGWCNAKSEMERLTPVYQLKGKTYKSGACKEKDGDTIKQTTSAKGYRLPSEAEWEWAARGGKNSKKYTYAGSNDLSAVGWFKDNSEKKTHRVGKKHPNEQGIYDMSGNVWEWCFDLKGTLKRCTRGGSWSREAGDAAVANRGYDIDQDHRSRDRGFRLARSSGN